MNPQIVIIIGITFLYSTFTYPDTNKEYGRSAEEKIDSPFQQLPKQSYFSIPTPEERTILETVYKEYENFDRRSQEYSATIDAIIRRSYLEKRKRLLEEYNAQIDAEQKLVENARKKAIKYYEEFIRKYPDNPKYTPDAMFRLGELYYEDSYESYLDALDKGEEARKDFSRTIETYKRLLRQFPDYKHNDGALYVMGYCLQEMGDRLAAQYAYLNIVCANKFSFEMGEEGLKETSLEHPAGRLEVEKGLEEKEHFVDPYTDCLPLNKESKFIAEAWLRIGEFHFDEVGKHDLDLAISAYKHVLEIKDTPYFDEALYKLAWSYYRAMQYVKAIKNFSDLVDYSDAMREKTGEKGSQLRSEAIQYIAISFSEDDWDGDNLPDQIPGFDGHPGIVRIQDPNIMPQDRKWTPEVYERLGSIYYDIAKYKDAIAIYQITLKKWPTSPKAPWIQDHIALCYQKLQMDEEALEARRELSEKYGPESEWAKANRDRPELIQNAMQLTENVLIETALRHHQRAQNMRRAGLASKNEELLNRAIQEYQLAANEYREYLKRFPNTPDAYELNFNLADALFFSGNYMEAAKEYEAVRDSILDNKHQEEAAFRAVKSWEQLLEEAKAKGAVSLRDAPPQPEGTPPRVAPISLPELLKKLIEARDKYIELFPQSERALVMRYQNAQHFYHYGHWDEAQKRFMALYEQFCDKDVARFSWEVMMNMANGLNNLELTEKLAKMQVERKCGVKAGEELKEGSTIAEAQRVLTAAQFRKAMEKFNEAMEKNDRKLFEEAAGMLVAAVDANPDHVEASGALNNAGIAYQRAGMYESAMQQFRRIVTDPRYSNTEFMDHALFQLAENAFRFFEYDEAINNYKIIAEQTRFSNSKYKAPSVLRTAIILTKTGRYNEAIRFWKAYAQLPNTLEGAPKKEEKIEAEFLAADMYRKMGRWQDMIKEMNSFIKNHPEKEAAPYRVKARYYIAQAYLKIGSPKDYWSGLKSVVDEFVKSGLPGGHEVAEFAAEAAFKLVDKDLPELENYKLKGEDPQKINKEIERIKELAGEFVNKYDQIKSFQRPNWTVASLFRKGYVLEISAKIILSATELVEDNNFVMNLLPQDVKRLMRNLDRNRREQMIEQLKEKLREGWGQKLSEMLEAQEQLAIKAYETCVIAAKEGNIVNEWTEKAYQRLFSYLPDQYPPLRTGSLLMEVNHISNVDLSTGDESKAK